MEIIATLNPKDFLKQPKVVNNNVLRCSISPNRLKFNVKMQEDEDLAANNFVAVVKLDNNTLGILSTDNLLLNGFLVKKVGLVTLGISNKKLCAYIIDFYKLTSSFDKGIIKYHVFDVVRDFLPSGDAVYILLHPKSFKPT